MLTLDEKRALCARPCSLDGRPAAVSGSLNPFASVARLDGGGSVEFPWATVARVVANGGAFKAQEGATTVPLPPAHLFPWLHKPWSIWQPDACGWVVGIRAEKPGDSDYWASCGLNSEDEARYIAGLHNSRLGARP